ncbi:MAG: metallophosphoesterase [Bdellovibrionaceae bacterium]|nr:metallophosphoesterase [Bdellovibrionales bacterium]MCB9083176.1 metallophosphoesterase [Pseudobdellovibrionaceae bacterium]
MKSKLVGIVGISLVLFFGLWGFWYEPGHGHHIKTYSIDVEPWIGRSYRVAVLADLHVGSPYNGLAKLEEIVSATNESQPDLILIAGDFVIHGVVGGTYVAPQEMVPQLSRLRAKDGVFAVLGNHDHWLDAGEVTRALEEAGIPVLTNRAVFMGQYWLVGIDDEMAGSPDIIGAFQKVTGDEPVLLFTHNPDIFPMVPDKVSLTIAGHTHGGQVYLPIIGRPIVPSKFGERFAIGHIKEGDKQMFVNPGTGTSIIPVRFLVPPEISIVEIH